MKARLALLLGFAAILATTSVFADCTVTNLGWLPLPDLGIGQYKGFTGGLYPNGLNRRPPAHEAAGLNMALNQITPRLLSGNIDTTNGKIVLLSIGLSNTTQEWATKGPGAFKPRADADASKNPQVVIVDGAQGGMDSTTWTNLAASTWTTVLSRLSSAGVSTNQVQVIWLKLARIQPNNIGAFPVHAQALQADLEKIARNIKSWFPNVKLTFCASRTRSYDTNPVDLNPEPFAYESSFSVKWLIEKQINGDPSLNYDTNRGPAVAPLLSWGPYLWTDGLKPRSDGLTWLCGDLENDLTHPNTNGVSKVADQLLAFFKTDALCQPWFLRKPTNGVTTTDASANANAGLMPLNVSFSNSVSGAPHWWTFGDGTFSTNNLPLKSFTSPGTYTAKLALADTNGNWRTGNVDVTVFSTYDLWAQKKFTAAELSNTNIAGQTADPDGDRISNLLEYLMGLEPKVTNGPGTGFPRANLVNGFVEYSFSRFTYNFHTPVLTGDITDLITNWSNGGSYPSPLSLQTIATVDNGMTETVTQRSSAALTNSPNQFLRLKALLVP